MSGVHRGARTCFFHWAMTFGKTPRDGRSSRRQLQTKLFTLTCAPRMWEAGNVVNGRLNLCQGSEAPMFGSDRGKDSLRCADGRSSQFWQELLNMQNGRFNECPRETGNDRRDHKAHYGGK